MLSVFLSLLLLYILTPPPPSLGVIVINCFKFCTRLNCRTNYFYNRLINDWNNLPDFIVNADSVINFKSVIDSYLFNCIFNFAYIVYITLC